MSKNYPILPLNTPLKLVAVHKTTMVSFEKRITMAEWVDFKKNNQYYYYTYQII